MSMSPEDRQQLNDTTIRVHELHTMMVKNGFAGAIKDTRADISNLHEKFDNYVSKERPETCFYLKDVKAREEHKEKHLRKTVAYIGILLTVFKIIDFIPRWLN